jgi:hypothetical protein
MTCDRSRLSEFNKTNRICFMGFVNYTARVAWIVKHALAAWIDRKNERRRLTLEALANVDAACVSAAAVQAWADCLGTEESLPR